MYKKLHMPTVMVSGPNFLMQCPICSGLKLPFKVYLPDSPIDSFFYLPRFFHFCLYHFLSSNRNIVPTPLSLSKSFPASQRGFSPPSYRRTGAHISQNTHHSFAL